MTNYVLIGVLQGVFEWLPVSSEGVVALASQTLALPFNPVETALFLHLGTVFAALFYFAEEWKEVFSFRNKKMVRFLLIATVVSLSLGYFMYKQIRTIAVGNVLLIIMGIGLIITAILHKTRKKINIKPDALAVMTGLLQGLAVIPGLSRSGSTIFALSLGGKSPSDSLKISYMMSVPVVLASSFYLLLSNKSFLAEGWPALISSFLVGFLFLDILMTVAKKINFFKFALVFGMMCLTAAFFQYAL